MKNTSNHIANYEKTIIDYEKQFEKCDMTSVNLGKIPKYLQIQESLQG